MRQAIPFFAPPPRTEGGRAALMRPKERPENGKGRKSGDGGGDATRSTVSLTGPKYMSYNYPGKTETDESKRAGSYYLGLPEDKVDFI